MANNRNVDDLIRQLDAHRDAYLETFNKVHEMLAHDLAATQDPRPNSPPPIPTRSGTRDRRALSFTKPGPTKTSTGLLTVQSSSGTSRYTGEDSDEEDADQTLYVQQPLEHQLYDDEGLRRHLLTRQWRTTGRTILKGLIDIPAGIVQPNLFPDKKGPAEDRSHLTHYQVFDVGSDGAPLPVELPESEKLSNALTIWNTLREVNPPNKFRPAVGRISIISEPSPILFGAVHFTHDRFFDVDQLFESLVEPGASSASFHRAFDHDPRRQRSFVFNLVYFTMIGRDCKPLDWQMADRSKHENPNHYNIKITRCSSVLALSLGGNHVKRVKNPARRAMNSHGFVYDTFAPWQVLNIQAYPDAKSSTDSHDSTKHYVNGVEAFLVTLLGEFQDAQDRFEEISKEVHRSITPPPEFMFDLETRDRLMFEDEEYTYSRRYFWAYQTLGLINDSIKALVDAYENTLVDEVWEGKHKTLWPLLDQDSPRSVCYLRRMASLRNKFSSQIFAFKTLMRENRHRREEVVGLREELYVGTSIFESRSSVKNTEITIQQGHNIKLLTLITIVFVPLTFATSVFGMENMPHDYWKFAIVTATTCVPFFILIGSLNTVRGMRFWRAKTSAAFKVICELFAWLCGRGWGGRPSSPNGEKDDATTGRRSTDRKSIDASSPADRSAARLGGWSMTQKLEMVPKDLEPDLESMDRVQQDTPRARKSSIARLWSDERSRDPVRRMADV